MRFAVAAFVITLASLTVFGQGAPTLRIVTEVPNLPSELYYGNIKVKPLRLRPGTTTPITINDTDFFVNQQYVDFLSRFPDQTGFDFWISQITYCGSNAACIDVARNNTSGAFFLSIEFQETGYYVYRLHKTSFGTLPRYATFMPNSRQVGSGVVVNQGNWQAQLETNKQNFVNSWVTSANFLAAYPLSLTNAAYVDKLIQTAGLTAGDVNRDGLVNQLNTGTSRATVLRQIAESPALNLKEQNPAFVLMQYYGYLRRNPDDAPDGNLDGYNYWLKKLNDHGGNFHAAEMVRSFLVSTEYLNRF